jgi:hypothetical protein
VNPYWLEIEWVSKEVSIIFGPVWELFVFFLPFWWLENQPQHQNKSSLSAFQWTLSF